MGGPQTQVVTESMQVMSIMGQINIEDRIKSNSFCDANTGDGKDRDEKFLLGYLLYYILWARRLRFWPPRVLYYSRVIR